MNRPKKNYVYPQTSIYKDLLLYIGKEGEIKVDSNTRSAIFPTHSPFAVTSPIFSPFAKALYIGVRVDVDVTAPTFYMETENI